MCLPHSGFIFRWSTFICYSKRLTKRPIDYYIADRYRGTCTKTSLGCKWCHHSSIPFSHIHVRVHIYIMRQVWFIAARIQHHCTLSDTWWYRVCWSYQSVSLPSPMGFSLLETCGLCIQVIYSGTSELGILKGLWRTILNSQILFSRSILCIE